MLGGLAHFTGMYVTCGTLSYVGSNGNRRNDLATSSAVAVERVAGISFCLKGLKACDQVCWTKVSAGIQGNKVLTHWDGKSDRYLLTECAISSVMQL